MRAGVGSGKSQEIFPPAQPKGKQRDQMASPLISASKAQPYCYPSERATDLLGTQVASEAVQVRSCAPEPPIADSEGPPGGNAQHSAGWGVTPHLGRHRPSPLDGSRGRRTASSPGLPGAGPRGQLGGVWKGRGGNPQSRPDPAAGAGSRNRKQCGGTRAGRGTAGAHKLSARQPREVAQRCPRTVWSHCGGGAARGCLPPTPSFGASPARLQRCPPEGLTQPAWHAGGKVSPESGHRTGPWSVAARTPASG